MATRTLGMVFLARPGAVAVGDAVSIAVEDLQLEVHVRDAGDIEVQERLRFDGLEMVEFRSGSSVELGIDVDPGGVAMWPRTDSPEAIQLASAAPLLGSRSSRTASGCARTRMTVIAPAPSSTSGTDSAPIQRRRLSALS